MFLKNSVKDSIKKCYLMVTHNYKTNDAMLTKFSAYELYSTMQICCEFQISIRIWSTSIQNQRYFYCHYRFMATPFFGFFRPTTLLYKAIFNKMIEEICRKSMWHGSFLRLAALRVIFFKKTKKLFLEKVYGSMCTKFEVCIVFRLSRRLDAHT